VRALLQGNDVGTQYRSAIFVADEAERSIAQAAIAAESMRLSKKVATTIEELDVFYPAESYAPTFMIDTYTPVRLSCHSR